MAADLRIFIDENCTKELAMTSLSAYVISLCTDKCLNGYTGESMNFVVYLKNVGDKAALHTSLIKNNDPSSFVIQRTKTTVPKDGILNVGDIKIDEIIPLYFCVGIPRSTNFQYYLLNFYLDYYTLPSADTTYYNPYTKKLCSICDANSTRYYVDIENELPTISISNGRVYITFGDDTFKITNTNFEARSIP